MRVTEKYLRGRVERLAKITGKPLFLETRSSIYGPYRYKVIHKDSYKAYPSTVYNATYWTAKQMDAALTFALEIEWERKEDRDEQQSGR